MSRAEWVYGACLNADLRKQVLARFVNRHTGEHRPKWVERDPPRDYKPLYATDLEWLHNTEFAVTKGGKLDARVLHCISHDPKRKPAP